MSYIENGSALRQRDPRIRDKAYLAWLSKLPCISCLTRRGALVYGCHCAHVKIGYPGMPGWRAFGHSEKSHDHHAVALCPNCHVDGPDAQHKNRGGDERDWWQALGVYPPEFCAALVKAFGTGSDPMAVMRHFAASAPLERARTGWPK